MNKGMTMSIPCADGVTFYAPRRAALWTAMIVLPFLSACSSLPKAPQGSGGGVPAGDGPPLAGARANIDLDAIPDAVPRIEPRSRYGNPPYYEVSGRRYYVRASSEGYVERGIASWYGTKFHGRRPFHENRRIELSYVAALKLGIVAEGTGLVEVRALKGDQASVAQATASTAPVRRTSPDIYLQAGAFADRANAERLTQRIAAAAPRRKVEVREANSEGRVLYRVCLGPLADVDEVDRVTRELDALGIKDAHVLID